MRNAFIFHGTCGCPGENWFPWMAGVLRERGCETTVPRFPTPKGQSLDSWREAFAPYMDSLGPGTVLIGHSLGAAFALDVLERTAVPVRMACFVAGFVGPLGDSGFDALNRTFVERVFDWERIRRTAGKVSVFVSDDDPYVPPDQSRGFAEYLGVEPVVMPHAGHFNAASGYVSFESLADMILQNENL